MATSVAKVAGKTIFGKHLKRYEPVDPLYETYTDNNGRQRRRKVRAILSPHTGWFHARIIGLTVKSIL